MSPYAQVPNSQCMLLQLIDLSPTSIQHHANIKPIIGPILVQCTVSNVGPTLGQCSASNVGPTLGQCWIIVGYTSGANIITMSSQPNPNVEPTMIQCCCQRWPNVGPAVVCCQGICHKQVDECRTLI